MSAKTDTNKMTDAESIATLTTNCTQLATSLKQAEAKFRKASRGTSAAALVLQGIVRAIDHADQDVGDAQALSDWLVLIEAAASHTFYLLTDSSIDEEMRGRA